MQMQVIDTVGHKIAELTLPAPPSRGDSIELVDPGELWTVLGVKYIFDGALNIGVDVFVEGAFPPREPDLEEAVDAE